MVLSCCDLLAVITNHPLMANIAMLWLTGNENATWEVLFNDLSNTFLGFSLLALLVMNFDRYLATYYPIFHRKFVGKRRLLGVFATLDVIFVLFSFVIVIPLETAILIFLFICGPPLLFINYKLFTISRTRRYNSISPDVRKTLSLKSISSCLLAVACFVALSIPLFVYIALRMNSKRKGYSLDDALLAGMWAKTIGSMNGTFNCLIFYWKNKILRTEGMKVIKSTKICEGFRT